MLPVNSMSSNVELVHISENSFYLRQSMEACKTDFFAIFGIGNKNTTL